MEDFDFDTWAKLAKTAPDEFEKRRREIIESLILRSSNVRRLRGLQWRIDMEISRSHTPLKACLRISTMMWESFLDLNSSWKNLTGKDSKPTNEISQHAKSAKVIHLVTENKPLK